MKARLHSLFISILVLLLFFSCSRTPFSVLGLHSSLSSVHLFDREGSLSSSYESLALFVELEQDAALQLEVISPDGLNSWIFAAEKQEMESGEYYGKGGLTLGQSVPLPPGTWSVRILNSDGRTLTESFTLEKGPKAPPFHHQLDAEKGLLVLDEGITEYSIQLLDEKKKVLHRSTTTEQTLDLTSLYPSWQKVHFVGLAWYDEAAKASQIVWYAL